MVMYGPRCARDDVAVIAYKPITFGDGSTPASFCLPYLGCLTRACPPSQLGLVDRTSADRLSEEAGKPVSIGNNLIAIKRASDS